MFTTLADFVIPPYVIPQQPEDADGKETFLQLQEKEKLTDLLGSLFYKAMKAGVEALPAVWSAATDYAVDVLVVVDGDIYKSLQTPNLNKTPEDEAAYWELQPVNKWLRLKVGDVYDDQNGVENDWPGMKAMCVPMLHACYLGGYASYMASLGVAVAEVENGSVVDPNELMSAHWSKYNRIASSCRDSLFGYLYNNAENFDEDVTAKGYTSFTDYLASNFELPGFMNTFGF